MATTDYIFDCPSDTEYDNLDSQAQEIIDSMCSEWPTFPMVGTREVLGRKMLHVRMTTSLTKSQLEDLFEFFSLDWTVLSIRNAYAEYSVIYQAEKSAFIPYINQIPDGESYRDVTLEDTIYMSCYAGTNPLTM